MDAERFATIVEAYGSDPRRWPAVERESARTFASGIEGRRLLARANLLDALLDAQPALQLDASLRRRVLEAAPQAPRPLWRPRFGLGWAPGALAAAGLAGVVFGAVLSHGRNDSGAERLLTEAAGFDEAVLMADLDREQL